MMVKNRVVGERWFFNAMALQDVFYCVILLIELLFTEN